MLFHGYYPRRKNERLSPYSEHLACRSLCRQDDARCRPGAGYKSARGHRARPVPRSVLAKNVPSKGEMMSFSSAGGVDSRNSASQRYLIDATKNHLALFVWFSAPQLWHAALIWLDSHLRCGECGHFQIMTTCTCRMGRAVAKPITAAFRSPARWASLVQLHPDLSELEIRRPMCRSTDCRNRWHHRVTAMVVEVSPNDWNTFDGIDCRCSSGSQSSRGCCGRLISGAGRGCFWSCDRLRRRDPQATRTPPVLWRALVRAFLSIVLLVPVVTTLHMACSAPCIMAEAGLGPRGYLLSSCAPLTLPGWLSWREPIVVMRTHSWLYGEIPPVLTIALAAAAVLAVA